MADLVAQRIAVCEALGLTPRDVRAITIRVGAGEEPTSVTVEYSVNYVLEHPEVADVLAQYELVPAAGQPPPDPFVKTNH